MVPRDLLKKAAFLAALLGAGLALGLGGCGEDNGGGGGGGGERTTEQTTTDDDGY
jgi:hypothetical protein